MTKTRENDPPKPGRGRRRSIGLLVAGLVLLGLLAGIFVRQVALGSDAARADIVAGLATLTGLPVTLGSKTADFRLLPVTRLSIADVRIGGDASGPLLAIERMVVDLDLWQALLGRTSIERLVLIRPELAAPAKAAADASLPKLFEPLLSRLHGLRSIEIRDGILRRDAGIGPAVVTAAQLSLSWPREEGAARLSGTYAWNGQPVELDIGLGSPLAWLDGKTSSLDLRLASPQLALSFEGSAASTGRLAGRLKASLPSLGRAVGWLGRTRWPVPEIGPLALEGDLVSDGRKLDIADAEVSIDGFPGRGALDASFAEGRLPSIGGTLAFERLDLDGIALALAPLPETPLDAAHPIPLGFVEALDLDLRLSAQTGRIGRLALADLAGTVKIADGLATLDIGDAALLGGRGQMRVWVDTHVEPPVLKGSAALRGVEASGLAAAFGLAEAPLSGSADLALSAESPVVSWRGILERHRLEAVLTARGGTLAGLDSQVLVPGGTARYDARAAAAQPFSSLEAVFLSRGPRLDLTSLVLANDGGTIQASGQFLGADRQADLSGTFVGPETLERSPSLTKPKPLGVTIRGPWPHPVIHVSADAGVE